MLINTQHWSSAGPPVSPFSSEASDKADIRVEMLQVSSFHNACQGYHSTSAQVYQGLGCKLLARYHHEKSTGPAVAEDKPELVGVFNLHMKRCDYAVCAEILVSASNRDSKVYDCDFMLLFYKKTRQMDRVQEQDLWEMIETGDCVGVASFLSDAGMTESSIHVLSRYGDA
jgi:hypothetical protein